MGAEAEFTAKEVAAHNDRNDCWMTIHGEVYNVTDYLKDHPGGVDIMLEVAGKDATEAFDSAGHSEDASEIMADFRVGSFKGIRAAAPKAVRIAVKSPSKPQTSKSSSTATAVGGAVVSLGALTAAMLGLRNTNKIDLSSLMQLLKINQPSSATSTGGFTQGFIAASALAFIASAFAARELNKMLSVEHVRGFAPHKKFHRVAKPDPLLARGFLDPITYHPLPLVEKHLIAPNVYRLVFALPTPDTVLGLPIGQHVAIKATIDGANVQRSYTPTSNNADKGVLELVIKCYPDGLLTGKYLAHLQVGDEVLFRGPKGAMQYRRGLCRKIGMLAGGTGITPMYQLIRAICEDPRDTTEVSLIYANRSEGDILLREELEAFARRYPRNLKIEYLLDSPPEGWQYGTGYVTKELMKEKFPDPSEEAVKVMLCGPPGMVNAAKKGLVDLGYEKAGLSSKMTDQVFCF